MPHVTIGPTLARVNHHGHIIEPTPGISGENWFAHPSTDTLAQQTRSQMKCP